MSGKRTKTIAILVAVFALGGAAGAATTYGLAVRGLHAKMRRPPHKARAKFRLEAMRRRLDLDDAQVAKLETIFEEMDSEKADAIRDCRPKLDAMRARMDARIDEVLTPEQREKNAKMRKRMRERFGSRPKASASAPAP